VRRMKQRARGPARGKASVCCLFGKHTRLWMCLEQFALCITQRACRALQNANHNLVSV
jgi:hypothetical protein